MRAKSSTLVPVIPIAEKTGRCEIRPNSYVRKIETDPHGRDRRGLFRCSAANGAETARLLLLSKSKRFPKGLANSSGLVGKYLMWDNGGLAMGLFEHPLNEYKGIQVTRVVHDYYRADPKRGLYGAHTMAVLAHTTSLAQLRNSISPDPDVKDHWGLPAMRVTFDYHPEVEILEAAGANKTWTSGASLQDDMPSNHVVDKFNRAHDVPNLVIADGSSFITAARQQPMATIQALAYRAADYAIQAAKRGELG